MNGPDNSDRLLEIGEIKAAFGVKGWVKVFSHCRPSEQIFSYPIWHIGSAGQWRKIELQAHQQRPNGGLIAKLSNIDDRDAALFLAGQKVAIEKAELAELKDGEYYWSQLIGLEVITQKSEKLGTVIDLMETGANDVLVVKNQLTEQLIPYAGSVVLEVDIEAGRMLVDWEADY